MDFLFLGDAVGKGEKTGKYIKCEECGKLTYFTLSRIKKNKHFFCSRRCNERFLEKQTHVYRKCEWCGQEMYLIKSSPQRFCSYECQAQWQKTRVGKLNPKYKRTEHLCDWCGKPHIVRQYRMHQEHLFCSVECKREWYAQVWSQAPEWKKASADRAAKMGADGKFAVRDTKPQLAVNDILDRLQIQYTREQPVSGFSLDNYLTESGLSIEVMGDFWHTNPITFGPPRFVRQSKVIERDIRKRVEIINELGHSPLYVWESDVLKNSLLIEKLILLYVAKDGTLENYHSFNYHLEADDELALNEQLILPFQEQQAS